MFCLGIRLDLFTVFLKSSLKSPLLAVAKELLSYVYIGKTIGSFLAPLLVYLIGFPPPCLLKFTKKIQPSRLFPPPRLLILQLLHPLILSFEFEHWNSNFEWTLTFRTFPYAIDSKNRIQRLREQKVKCSNEFFHGFIHNWSAKICIGGNGSQPYLL